MKIPASALIAILVLGPLAPSTPAQTTGSFVQTGSMTAVRIGHAATLLPDGRVLLTGGNNKSAELYDPTTGTFTATGSMRVSRWMHLSILMADGRVLVAGGCYCVTAEIYDPATGTFALTGDMNAARFVTGAALLKDGNVLVAGDKSVERYDPTTGTFTLMNGAPTYGSAIALLNGKVLIGDPDAAQLYSPATNSFETVQTGNPVGTYRADPATPLSNGQILFAGGALDAYGEVATAKATLYDPRSGFQDAGQLHQVRSYHTTTLLKDGRVLIAGGYNGDGPDSTTGIFSSTELYDPATNTFTNLPNMTRQRDAHTATLLQDGRVLIAGGRIDYARGIVINEGSAELFVPDNVHGAVPFFAMDSSQYCVGESWRMQVSGAPPSSKVTLMGIWDQVPWSIPGWGSTTADGNYAAEGTFDAGSGGDHMLWVLAGDKVSKTFSLKISECRVGLSVESAFRIGSPWLVRVSSNLRDAVVTLDGTSNGVPWQIPVWGRTKGDGSFETTGAFPAGVEGDHELRVRVGSETSRTFRFRVLP